MFALPPEPLDRLPADAVRHLAHEMRGALHTILGHSELLAVEAHDSNARESAQHIHTSAAKLSAWVDDVVDLLRLPAVAERGEARLDLRGLLETPTAAAKSRGVHVLLDERSEAASMIGIDRSVERIVRRVLETLVATAKTDMKVRCEPCRPSDTVAVISVAPVPDETSNAESAVLAIAARVLAAQGGGIVRTGERVALRVPTCHAAES